MRPTMFRIHLLTLLALLVMPLTLIPSPVNGQSVSKLGKALQRAAKKKDYDAFNEVLGRLGDTDDEKATAVILKALALVPLEEAIDGAIQALVSLGSEKIGPTFDKLLKKKRPDSVALAIMVQVAAQVEDDTSEGWLLTALEHGTEFVVRNTIPTLVERKSKKAIPLLIDRLEKVGMDPSTSSYQTRDALVALTGHDFETVEDWRSFWETRKDTLDPKNLEKEFEGPTGLARKLSGKDGDYQLPEFFGVPILSNRVIFVVDVSGSMELWDGDDEAQWRERRRITRVKNQLLDVVAKLPAQATFNIISFSDSPKPLNARGAVPATPKWKKKAKEFVNGMKAVGPTFTGDALERAFLDREVDTVVLLSDGAPSQYSGKPKELMAEILERVAKLNRISKVTLHTFGFTGEGKLPPGMKRGKTTGGNPDDEVTPEELVQFLTDLAEQNGGKFTEVE